MRVCVVCGEKFKAERLSARYCGSRCKKRAYRSRKKKELA